MEMPQPRRCLQEAPAGSVGLVGTQRSRAGTCWAPPGFAGTRSAPQRVSPGTASRRHRGPHAPPPTGSQQPPTAVTATSTWEDLFFGVSFVVEPKGVSQTTGHKVSPAAACAIRVVVGLALTCGPLRGVSLTPPLFFGEGNLCSALPHPSISISPSPAVLMGPKTCSLKNSTKPKQPTGSFKS